MKKTFILILASMAGVAGANAQSAIDAYRLSQPDLKGTARFMSMGGAFGALGGDLSTLSQNPAGIGVYRSNDIGFTVDLDMQSADATSQGRTQSINQTKFLLNNIGGVFTMKLPSYMCPNLNIGFTYNKAVSFNRQYAGGIPQLGSSMTNYIAGICNGNEVTVGDVTTSNGFNPYNPNDGMYAAPWLSILGYDSYLVSPSDDSANANWYGQWEDGHTTGRGSFAVREKGSVDEYNIAIGGNISNVLYWGMNFDLTNIDYTMNTRWSESLDNAYVDDEGGNTFVTTSDWDLSNYYNVHGSGFNWQLGFILKPIQELRLGVAVHTPTWYNLTETYGASTGYSYGNGVNGGATTDNGNLAYNDVSFRTPWKVIGSIAGVIENRLILSMDYEWIPYNKMKYSEAGSYGFGGSYDWGDDFWYPYSTGENAPTRSAYAPDNDPYYDTNSDIKQYYTSTNTIRLGAEYRVSPAFSLRAGYSFTSSPVKSQASSDHDVIWTSGTMPNYRFDNTTNYITCGFGYRYQQFYIDMAYVYKNMKSTYHAYSPDVDARGTIVTPSPQSSLKFNNSQVVLTAGFRF